MSTLTITEIRWKRAILELVFTEDEPNDDTLYLYRTKEKRFIPFTTINEGDHKVARINITIAGERKVLSRGQWIIARKIDDALLTDLDTLLAAKPHLLARIEHDVRRHHKAARRNEEVLAEYVQSEGLSYVQANPYDTYGINYLPSILEEIDQYSRFFRYAKDTYVYTVSMKVRESSEKHLYVFLDVEFYMRNPNPDVRKKSKRFTEKRIMSAYFNLLKRVTKRDGKQILFFKNNADGPTENMQALQTRITERGLDQEFRVVNRYHNIFKGKQKLGEWLKDLSLIAKSDYIFIDDYAPIFNFIELDDDVVLTQLWHAGVGFKSVGYARFGLKGSPDPNASCHRHYTYALIGNEHLRDIYSEVFGIEPEALLATGMPRLDHFLEPQTAEAARNDLYERYPELEGHRVILFAPTFRGTGQRTAYYPYDLVDIPALHELCLETDSYFIFEMHHFIRKRPPIEPEYQDRVLDLTDESLNELFHIADVLITDYSSCFYDYLLLKRPVVLYVPDKVAYTATRGVQRPIDEMAPGEVCESFDELLDTLRTRHYEEVEPKALTIDRAAEGGMLASDRAIDTILLGKDVPGVRMKG